MNATKLVLVLSLVLSIFAVLSRRHPERVRFTASTPAADVQQLATHFGDATARGLDGDAIGDDDPAALDLERAIELAQRASR